MSSAKPHQPQKDLTTKPRSLKRALFLTGVSALMVLLVLFFIFRSDSLGISGKNVSNQTATSKTAEKDIPDISRLIGRWSRPDGGYILEIRSAAPEGQLDVGYFNPNPIHVARAEWVQKDGKLYVMAELQDVNYPGSVYGLEYNVSQDQLTGTYYQALEKSTYDVQFVREK